jgi:hypothetical protein
MRPPLPVSAHTPPVTVAAVSRVWAGARLAPPAIRLVLALRDNPSVPEAVRTETPPAAADQPIRCRTCPACSPDPAFWATAPIATPCAGAHSYLGERGNGCGWSRPGPPGGPRPGLQPHAQRSDRCPPHPAPGQQQCVQRRSFGPSGHEIRRAALSRRRTHHRVGRRIHGRIRRDARARQRARRAAGPIAVELIESDAIALLELCGGFGAVDAARVIEAVHGRVPVGHVAYALESLEGAARYKSAFAVRQ